MKHRFGAASPGQFFLKAHAQHFAQSLCASGGILFNGHFRLFCLSVFQGRPPHILFFVEESGKVMRGALELRFAEHESTPP